MSGYRKCLPKAWATPTIGLNGPQVSGITVNGSSTPFKNFLISNLTSAN